MTEIARELYPVGYVVTPMPGGFSVDRNLADASWVIPFGIANVKSVIGHHVALDQETGALRITDTAQGVTWRVGMEGLIPTVHTAGGFTIFRGRRMAIGGTKQYGMRPDGSIGAIQDYTYNTQIVREVIERTASAQGWNPSRKRPPMTASQRIGLVAGIGGGVLALAILAVRAFGLVG